MSISKGHVRSRGRLFGADLITFADPRCCEYLTVEEYNAGTVKRVLNAVKVRGSVRTITRPWRLSYTAQVATTQAIGGNGPYEVIQEISCVHFA